MRYVSAILALAFASAICSISLPSAADEPGQIHPSDSAADAAARAAERQRVIINILEGKVHADTTKANGDGANPAVRSQTDEADGTRGTQHPDDEGVRTPPDGKDDGFTALANKCMHARCTLAEEKQWLDRAMELEVKPEVGNPQAFRSSGGH